MTIEQYVANFLGLNIDDVVKMSNLAPYTYKGCHIPKAGGGERWINQPSRKTKSLQYAILTRLVPQIHPHDIATAYRRQSSPQRKTAEIHTPFAYSIRIDFADFLHSIVPEDLFSRLDASDVDLEYRKNDFLKNVIFQIVKEEGGSSIEPRRNRIKRGDLPEFRLAIGAPASPYISNIAMYDLDVGLLRAASRISVSHALTRYADDIVFSSNEKGACKEFLHAVRELVEEHERPNLRLNESKTTFMSRGTRRMIVGLIVTPDGKVSVGRERKRRIRSLMHSFGQNQLDAEEVERLKGTLAWVKDVEPGLINRLTIKYGSSLMERVRGKS